MVKFIFIMITILAIACGRDHDMTREQEKKALKSMLVRVNKNLHDLGFSIDLSQLRVEIEDKKAMADLFNQINRESLSSITALDDQDDHLFNDGVNSRLAFYDPNRKTIIFKNGALRNITDGYLAHELAHAYQDQKWGFDRIWHPYQKNPSLELFNITKYMIEGHAELMRKFYEEKNNNLPASDENECLKCFMPKTKADFPYIFGMNFLLKQYHLGGVSLAEKYLLDLPSSSEQIIHPDKLKVDEPSPLNLPDIENASVLFENTLGEAFLLGKLLSLPLTQEKAVKASSGWDGDLIKSYQFPNNKEALLWRIAFDRPIDAKQLEESLKRLGLDEEIQRDGNIIDWIMTDDKDILYKIKSMTKIQLSKIHLDGEMTTLYQESRDCKCF